MPDNKNTQYFYNHNRIQQTLLMIMKGVIQIIMFLLYSVMIIEILCIHKAPQNQLRWIR